MWVRRWADRAVTYRYPIHGFDETWCGHDARSAARAADAGGYRKPGWPGGLPMIRLLTNFGRIWTGTEILSNTVILMQDDHIAWAGLATQLPPSIPGVIDDIVDVDQVENLGGALVTPGLIDSHTHPVYAGNRWAELAMRSGGSSVAEIAAAGGGLNSTVTITRGTDPWTLCSGVRERLRSWLMSGTTTIEAKTGYHLTRDGELADVRLLRSLEDEPGMP